MFVSVPATSRLAAASMSLMISVIAAHPAVAQDYDQDGINDILEHKLAQRFAPEWRFNIAVEGDNSFWNYNEVGFPASVEWFQQEIVRQTGEPPLLCFYDLDDGPIPTLENRRCVPITDIRALATIADPEPPHLLSDDPSRIPDEMRIENFPEWMGGYPELFPTYYECFPYGNGTVGLYFTLWFPWDYAPSPAPGGLFAGTHRGDWENIKVVVSDVGDLGAEEPAATAQIAKVIYYGHELPPKLVRAGDPELRVVEGTHPQVFVSNGSHAMYPEPGEVHNIIAGIFDDFFHGNGYVAQAWNGGRELVNLGEYEYDVPGRSLQPWLRFAGLWGPDGSSSQGSPKGPPFRGRWGTSDGTPESWAQIKVDRGVEVDATIPPPGGIPAEGARVVALFHDRNFRQCDHPSVACFFVDPFLTLPEGGALEEFGSENDETTSVLLAGGAKVQLFVDASYVGDDLMLSHSCEHLGDHLDHGFNDRASSAREVASYPEVHVDGANAAGYQDGSAQAGVAEGPVATIGRAQFLADTGAAVFVRAGNYFETLTLKKAMTINAVGGQAVIGRYKRPSVPTSAVLLRQGSEETLHQGVVFGLTSTRPNPSTSSARVDFVLPSAGSVDLALYDVRGRRVRTLERGVLNSGHHVRTWDGLDETGKVVASGVYFIRLTAPQGAATRTLVVRR